MKKGMVLLEALFVAAALTACSDSTSVQTEGRTMVVTVSTAQPENHPTSVGIRAMKDYIEENLGEGVEVRIFYNGVIGQSGEALELLQMGTLDFVMASGSNMEAFSEMYSIFGLPYLFKNEESFRKCMNDEKFISQIYESTVDKGIQGVTWFANGVNNIYSTRPIRTPEDMKGLKFRVQTSEANVKMAQAMGAAAVIMNYGEVYTALQNHVIDAAANPEMALVSVKHGEVAPYYSRTEHQIFTDMLVCNSEFLNSLSDHDREIFEESFKIANQVECEEWDRQIEVCIEEAEKMGVEFIEVDKAPFEQLEKPVREELLAATPALQPLYDRVQEIQKGE